MGPIGGYRVRSYCVRASNQKKKKKQKRGQNLRIIHIHQAHVRPVGRQTGIPIQKVLQVKDGRKAHGTGGQRAHQLRMTGVDGLQHLALVLDAGPVGPQPGQLVHLPSKKLGAGRKHLALTALVVHAVHVDGSRRADAVPDKGRPFDQRGVAGQLDELGNGVGVRKTQVRGLDLPRLVLAGATQLDQVNGQERAVDQTVDEMIDELA